MGICGAEDLGAAVQQFSRFVIALKHRTFQMDSDAVIAKFREHEVELRSAGIEHLSLFGSVARGDNS